MSYLLKRQAVIKIKKNLDESITENDKNNKLNDSHFNLKNWLFIDEQ